MSLYDDPCDILLQIYGLDKKSSRIHFEIPYGLRACFNTPLYLSNGIECVLVKINPLFVEAMQIIHFWEYTNNTKAFYVDHYS